MALASGARIGPYEIVSPLGAGGMGEVYRARDTKLGREVAIKVLPEHLANDRDRLTRFEREAQVLASLNHQHIAAVHGVEESSGVPALVMELVEGDTLADRIAKGPLPTEEALAIAAQIAAALEAAHDHGIIHRDIKPSNVKVRPDGTVKVLDFGLAKLTTGDAGATSSSLSMSPTITSPSLTVAGVILGTAAYMSPEQARGKTVDRRSDIWAFGCVLFEMLAGRPAFEAGDNISDVVAAILRSEPDWSLLGSDVPPRVDALLRRCLRKDPRKRLPHIGVVRLELEEADDGEPKILPSADPPVWKRALPVSVAMVVTGVLVGLVMWGLRPAVPVPQVLRFPIIMPGGTLIDGAVRAVAVSPDGTRVAIAAGGRIYLRNLAETEARPIAGSEVTQGYLGDPVFSPDGGELVYWTGTAPERATLKRISINGGSAVTVATASFAFGTTWGERGIVFAQGAGLAPNRIMRVVPDGGMPETLVTLAETESPSSPQVLPGGDAVLFTLSSIRGPQELTQENWDRSRVVVQDLGSGQRKTIVNGGSDARYVPTGHVIYLVGTTVFALPFDAKRLEPIGAPVQVFEGPARTLFGASVLHGSQLSVSETGTAIYLPDTGRSAAMVVALIDPQTGLKTRLNGVPPGEYSYPRVSPDGRRLAVVRETASDANIWIYDLAGTTAFRQLTSGGRNLHPIWSPDGTNVAFQSDRDGDLAIFRQQVDGGGRAERLTKPEQGVVHIPGAWSLDGRTILFEVGAPAGSSSRLSKTLWSWEIDARKGTPLGGTSTNPVFAISPTFSPDGRWFAYSASSAPSASDLKVYVKPFPVTDAAYPIDDGVHPFWSRDGKQLYYRRPPPDGLTGVTVDAATGFKWRNPQPIKDPGFRLRGPSLQREIDILPDGRFVGIVEANTTNEGEALPSTQAVRVVVNWFEELRRVGSRK